MSFTAIKMNSLKRFIFGFAVGLFVAAIAWSYSVYFQISIALVQGIVGSLLLAISCGIVATIGNLDKLMDNIPHL